MQRWVRGVKAGCGATRRYTRLLPSPSLAPAPCPQIEEFEAEAEAAATTKKGKKPAPRVVHMEESITRHRQHIMRLEQLLRLLDNDAVQGAWGRGAGIGSEHAGAAGQSWG